jgi:diaminohydroxyphosphoribosylaminopyrimidine deaminase/5-amino-6-(5-phosphoribosylamino)uracil reductase
MNSRRVTAEDRRWLDVAFALAERGRIGSSPNPMVGAVVVAGGRIVGQGFHARAGGPHAEAIALEQAGELARGAVLYVTLEPCCHQGRTGPCVERVLDSGVREVVAAATDSNPLVAGEGFRRLAEAGVGLLRDAAPERERLLNERFRCAMEKGRPFVALKMALSLDGKSATATGDAKWITGSGGRARVQMLREELDAVAVGIGTVLADDPRLTRRLGWRASPPLLRVIFDRTLRLPLHARLFDDPAPVLVVTMEGPDVERAALLCKKGAEVLPIPGGAEGLSLLLGELHRREVRGLLVEGGATLAASFLSAGLVDRWYGFVAPILVGGERAPGGIGGEGIDELVRAPRLRDLSIERIGDDLLLSGVLGTCSPA